MGTVRELNIGIVKKQYHNEFKWSDLYKTQSPKRYETYWLVDYQTRIGVYEDRIKLLNPCIEMSQNHLRTQRKQIILKQSNIWSFILEENMTLMTQEFVVLDMILKEPNLGERKQNAIF